MAVDNTKGGKFTGLDNSVDYDSSFTVGARMGAVGKLKDEGNKNNPLGFIVDAIDIDWGGLKLTTIKDGWAGTETVSSTKPVADSSNQSGIRSTAYLLNKISNSFSQIYAQIGGSDSSGIRKRIKDVETSISAMAGLTPEELTNIQNDLTLIKQELEGTTVNSWTTLVDKLAGLGNGVTVKNYVDTAKSSAISTAASDATTKADKALSDAKSYADTKKTEAINAAATTAQQKADAAKSLAVSESKGYTDTEIAKLSNDIELTYIGCNNYTDTKVGEVYTTLGNFADEVYTTLGAITDSAMGVRRIEEDGEGILEFLNVGNSYSYSYIG